ncbi:MAG: DNA mismatch repair protein MutS, partial [Deltaproteobacteria bacterium]
LDYLKRLVGQQVPFPFWCSDEVVEGIAAGVDAEILPRLRRGDFSVQAHLDLHGLTRDEAREKVAQFIDTSLAMGRRCVLIIHGRGRGSKDKQPVLKQSLCRWLTRSSLRKKVLAFTTARPCDGGAGAIYVLLRKSTRLVHT